MTLEDAQKLAKAMGMWELEECPYSIQDNLNDTFPEFQWSWESEATKVNKKLYAYWAMTVKPKERVK